MNGKHCPLSPAAREFRRLIIDALWDRDRFGWYVHGDLFIGTCPIREAPIAAHFHRPAPRVTVSCAGGCTEQEVGDRLGLVVRP